MTTLLIFLAVAAAIGFALLLTLAAKVDNWQRDLSTNFAETTQAADDPALHPLRTELPPAELAKIVARAVADIPRWQQADHQSTSEDQAGSTEKESLAFHFVRTTPLLRFRDDIHVQITPTAAGSELNAQSRSRIGKGDLGQNPRNLKELLAAVRARLP